MFAVVRSLNVISISKILLTYGKLISAQRALLCSNVKEGYKLIQDLCMLCCIWVVWHSFGRGVATGVDSVRSF